MAQIVILGAGFGGLSAANELQKLLGDKHKIILIDKRKKFFVGASKLWVMLGKRTPESCEKDISLIERKGIKFVNDVVVDINTEEKKVFTATNYFKYDYLIISLGAELLGEIIPGFNESALNLYDMKGAFAISQEMEKFYRGRIVILVSRLPFKCPAAPYEAALLLDEYFKNNGRRENVAITICTPEPQPLPVAGKQCGAFMIELLKSRGINLLSGSKALSIDDKRRTILLENGHEEFFDILLGIPQHIIPKAIKKFANDSGWITVSRETLKTATKDVYAIGDCTGVKLSNGLSLPKAGIFAEDEAKAVAFNIASEINEQKDKKAFEGKGYCFLETGNQEAAKIQGAFFNEPEPVVEMTSISHENYQEKLKFEKDRLEGWF